jgi:hypothetical protein
MNVPFLGELALNPAVRIGGDSGAPVTTRPDGDTAAEPFRDLARRLDVVCGSAQSSGPKITIED